MPGWMATACGMVLVLQMLWYSVVSTGMFVCVRTPGRYAMRRLRSPLGSGCSGGTSRHLRQALTVTGGGRSVLERYTMSGVGWLQCSMDTLLGCADGRGLGLRLHSPRCCWLTVRGLRAGLLIVGDVTTLSYGGGGSASGPSGSFVVKSVARPRRWEDNSGGVKPSHAIGGRGTGWSRVFLWEDQCGEDHCGGPKPDHSIGGCGAGISLVFPCSEAHAA